MPFIVDRLGLKIEALNSARHERAVARLKAHRARAQAVQSLVLLGPPERASMAPSREEQPYPTRKGSSARKKGRPDCWKRHRAEQYRAVSLELPLED